MKIKTIILVFLLVLVNIEWVFIGLNYQLFADLEKIEKDNINVQDDYLNEIKKGVSIHLDDNGNKLEKRYIDTPREIAISKFLGFRPNKIVIPSINIESPVYNTNRNIESLLNKGVVNFSEGKEGFYIFGHSSSKVESPFSYIFTKITKLKKGDIITLEDDNNIYLYEYKDFYYKKPDKLNELEDGKDKVFLLTCYPFNTSITRYITEFTLKEKIKKKK